MADIRMVPQRYEPLVSLDQLHRHPANPNDGDLGLLCTLLDANGFAGAVMAQESTGILVDGETRLDAAQANGMRGLPVIWLDISDDERDRLLAEWNYSGRMGRDDEAKLIALLQGLATSPGGLAGTGRTGSDLDDLITRLNGRQPSGRTDPDDAPEPPAEPVTRPGDLWLAGPHRLLCGDATSPADVKRVMDGLGPAVIIYADPPYGMSTVPKDGGVSRSKLAKAARYMPVAGDGDTATATAAFALLAAEYPHAAHVWWGANHYAASAGLPDASCWLVWDKDNGGSDFADAELAWTNHRGAVRLLRHMWAGMLRASERDKRVHPTQKPVVLAEWAFRIADPDAKADTVLAPFAGSGSDLIAAHRTGRTGALIEIEPPYCDVILARWEAHTGIIPERVQPDGTTEPVSFTPEPAPA